MSRADKLRSCSPNLRAGDRRTENSERRWEDWGVRRSDVRECDTIKKRHSFDKWRYAAC